MNDAWPVDGYLLHPSFGLVPYEQRPLPLEERALSPAWQGLDDDVQDERLQQTWRLIWGWAQRCGADQLEGDFTRSDWPVAAAAGLNQRSGSRYRWGGTLSAASLDGLWEANPERLWITIRGELIVYVHETWDSVVVRGGEEELRELQRDVTALQAQWN